MWQLSRMSRAVVFLFLILSQFGCSDSSGRDESEESCSRVLVLGGTECRQTNTPVVRVLASTFLGTGDCSGVIVSKTAILTSAHCLIGALSLPTVVFADGTSVASNGLSNITPYLEMPTPPNDFAIVKIPFDALQDRGIEPIAVIPELISPTLGSLISVHGYGEPQSAPGLELPRSAFMIVVEKSEVGSFLAAPLDAENGGSSCEGDSGGPAVLEYQPGVFAVVGLVSEGEDSSACFSGSRTIFTSFDSAEVRELLREEGLL